MSSSFTSLPRELRQRILLLSLPQNIQRAVIPYFSRPAQHLLQICREIRNDMSWVLSRYSPNFYFNNPSHLSEFLSSLNDKFDLLAFDYKPKFEHVTFSIFDDAKVDTMQWTCYCLARQMHTHDELVNAWARAVPTLPEQVKTITLDITPAPGWMRRDRPNWIQSFVQDRRVSKAFVSEHEGVTLLLIQVIYEYFGDGATIQLSGQVSAKSRSSLDALAMRSHAAGMDVVFVGDVLDVQHIKRTPKIQKAVQKLAPLRCGWIHDENRYGDLPPKNEQEQRFARLRKVKWSADTQNIWTRVSNEDEVFALDLLISFGQFVTNEFLNQMDFSPMVNRRRALVHKMAHDLACTSESIGEHSERYVRVRKNGSRSRLHI
jgi:hypothetical protein